MADHGPGAGFDRRTGKILSGWPHVVQSLEVLFTTRFGERVMREWVASFVPAMLGQNLIKDTILKTTTAIYVAVDVFEPRYAIRRFNPLEATRGGYFGLEIIGEYRPYGHLGDPRPESLRSLRLTTAGERLRLTDATP